MRRPSSDALMKAKAKAHGSSQGELGLGPARLRRRSKLPLPGARAQLLLPACDIQSLLTSWTPLPNSVFWDPAPATRTRRL
jgi:hypothetical protein